MQLLQMFWDARPGKLQPPCKESSYPDPTMWKDNLEIPEREREEREERKEKREGELPAESSQHRGYSEEAFETQARSAPVYLHLRERSQLRTTAELNPQNCEQNK